MSIRRLHYSDNLPVLQEMPDSYVDLIYLDPPFNSKRVYNIVYPDDESQATAFVDIWWWSPETDQLLNEIKQRDFKTYNLLQSLIDALGKAQICCYLVNMTVRLIEMRRVLKDTGSIYLHCDPTASHYLKIVMDRIWGGGNFRNEIIWTYGLGGSSPKQWSKKHDVLLFYSKTGKWYFDKPLIPATSNRMKGQLKGMTDVWHIPSINNQAKERTGYPTQKPIHLLDRIVRASSNEGDIVLDPFCGCGTTIVAAELLKRQWIGIDITYTSISVIKSLLEKFALLGVWGQTNLLGVPTTRNAVEKQLLKSASAIARKEFEKFAVVSIGGYPNEKMGADGGIDGRIPLPDNKTAIVSVKSGKVDVRQVRELKGLLNGKNKVGIFITKQKPTRDMMEFANRAGLYQPDNGFATSEPVPAIQILELEEILRGKQPQLTP